MVFIFLLLALPLGAMNDYLYMDFSFLRNAYIEKDKDIQPTFLTQEEVLKDLLTEMQYIFSSMIFPSYFIYKPYDVYHKQEDFFESYPKALLPWGYKDIEIYDEWYNKEKLEQFFSFKLYLNPKLKDQRRLLINESVYHATAMGEVDFNGSYSNILQSLQEALKNGIRDKMRKIVNDKPRSIEGELLIKDVSSKTIDGGKLQVSVSFYFRPIKISTY